MIAARSERLGEAGLSILAWAIYVFLALPCLLVVPMAFADRNSLVFPPAAYSLYLFARFFGSPVWSGALVESLVVATSAAIIAVTCGTLAAYGLVRGQFPGRRLIGLVMLAPMMLPTIILALGIYLYFVRLGLTGTTLGLVLAHATLGLPFALVTVAAGLRQIDPSVERAAATLGASRLVVVRRIVLPQIVPSVMAGVLFAFLVSFDEVVIAWFVSGNGATTLPVVMYGSLQMEVSPIIAAAATLLSAVSVTICVLSALLQRRTRKLR